MSGGHFDYRNYELNYIEDRIREDMEAENHDPDERPIVQEMRKFLINRCALLNDLLHGYDYYMSGDRGEERFIACFIEDLQKYTEALKYERNNRNSRH